MVEAVVQARRSLLFKLLIVGWLGGWICPQAVRAEDTAEADVVVIVDTSTSMRETGMDPDRTSLLVTQLLADIVPGQLAAVRLLDLKADGDLLPSVDTGRVEPCDENPSRMCNVVEPASDWAADARSRLHGVLRRPRRGDASFARELDGHLEQRIQNSPFYLAFHAALGVFDKNAAAGLDLPRTVIWLSDGRADQEEELLEVLAELKREKVGVEAIVFGRGQTILADRAGLDSRRTSGPADLMRAFAGAFRRIVKAPYEIDARIAARKSFVMQPAVDEAWVVVYGDDTLGEVTLIDSTGRRRPADYAARRFKARGQERGGAYRVAHGLNPPAGSYTVEATGGGPDVAYAVVQRSSLRPRLVEPTAVTAGEPSSLVVEIVAGDSGALVTDDDILQGARLTAELVGTGRTPIALTRRADGRFEGPVVLDDAGDATIRIHLTSPVVDRAVEVTVAVSGSLSLYTPEVSLDFGRLGVDQEVCRPLLIDAEHQGAVPVTLRLAQRPPSGHRLFLRFTDDEAGRETDLWQPDEPKRLTPCHVLEVCLATDARAPSSEVAGEPWLRLEAPAEQTLTARLSWRVEGLGFWARWGWLILWIFGLILAAFVVAGFVLPHRFPPGLALVFVDDREEIDEQQPQPIRQWKGVRIGFYRHAKAYLHNSFRVTGKSRGALAVLVAESRGARVLPGKGAELGRETLDGTWEPVGPAGRRARAGDVYRIGESGPYFRVASRGARS